ncbi:MAG: acylphosphatase [Thermoplasmataceae archaeon]
MKTLVVLFHGRVQGVNFRRSFAELARLHGIVGQVENLPDGSVRAYLQGSDDEIEELISEAQTHIKAAKIESLERSFLDMGPFRDFQIKR